ncbi:hypothetical protein WJX79_004793 [Trebouxia sp. C0005]
MGLHRRAIKAMFPKGVISKVHRDLKKPGVTVKGMNLYKKHIKRTQDRPGGIVDIEKPIAYSNVALVDPVTKAPCRSTWRYLEDGTKVRITRGKLASGSPIPRPTLLAKSSRTRSYVGKKDTPVAAVRAVTYVKDQIPPGLDRVASILAGRVTLPVVDVNQVTSSMSGKCTKDPSMQKMRIKMVE